MALSRWDLIPSSRYCNALDLPLRLFDQHFGNSLLEEEILHPQIMHPRYALNYPRRLHSRKESGLSEMSCDKDKFQLKLDVQHFKPEELDVKVVNNEIVVEGKHEDRADDHGYISRQFVRRYMLPEEVKPDDVICDVSSDGVLEISAKRLPALAANEHKVVINQTNKPSITCKSKCDAGQASEEQPMQQGGGAGEAKK